MLLLKNRTKLIFFYIFLLAMLSSTNNINFKNLKNFFEVKLININGIENLNKTKLIDKLGIFKKKNIFFINKNILNNILKDINYVDSYSVSKVYPSQINIFLKKTEFVGITYIQGTKYLIGLNGKIIIEKNHKYQNNLPVIFGEFLPQNYIEILNKLKNNKFDIKNILEFYYYKNERWDLTLKNNIKIKLPNHGVDSALKIAKLYIDQTNHEKKIIDLRVANQVIISNE